MSGVVTFINVGFADNFFQLWFRAFTIVFPIAFPLVLFFVPVAQKFAGKITE